MTNHDNVNIEVILDHIHQRFYQHSKTKAFFRDRKMLIHAITWPALWLEERGLATSKTKYQSLILNRLTDIQTYGSPEVINQYFPRYLLKCLQTWFHYNGDDLYAELKHIRNSMDIIIDRIHQSDFIESYQTIEILAKAHTLCKPQKKNKKHNHNQLNLFQ